MIDMITDFAECLIASDYEKTTKTPSEFVEGAVVITYNYFCPVDKEIVDLPHGKTVHHECGLRMQRRGNFLYVWR